jgi:serine/threonine protein kinase
MSETPDKPTDSSKAPDPSAAPTSAGHSPSAPNSPSGTTPPSGSNRDRDLINAAIQDQTPFEPVPGFGADLPPADTFPGFDLIREIHRGGQGVVYLALQRTTKRRVAIKVMHSGPFGGSKGKARFEREVQILGQLNHPNIVGIHDSGVTKDGSFFYVMDYISGRTLSEHLNAKKLDLESMLRLFTKICQGVNAAHMKGVIHRDLKPANIRVDQSGEPIIVDFGLAKVTMPESLDAGDAGREVMSMTGQFIGSLPWASPEQAEGVHVNIDTRTDVYSLGVIFYQMLTGRFPYEVVGNMRDVLDRILRAEPVKPTTVRRAIGDEVETIVLKCLRKERDRRYQSAGDLARDVERYLQGQPIDAKSDSGWYVISKTLRRYRMPVGVAVAFLLTIVAFSVVMAVLYKQKSNAEVAARTNAAVAVTEREQAEENASIALGLASTMLYDFPPAIDKLVGSTQAKRTLLSTLETQIKRLSEASPESPSLASMLADSLELAGDLRSGLSLQSSGTLDQAEANYTQCLTVRTSLASTTPGPLAEASLGSIKIRLAALRMQRQDFAAAESLAREAVAHYDAAIRNAPDTKRAAFDLSRLEAQVRIADAILRKSEKGDPSASLPALDSALEEYERLSRDFAALLAADSSNTKAARWVGVMFDKQSTALFSTAARLRADGAKKNKATPGSGNQSLAAALELATRASQLSATAVDELARLAQSHPRNGELKRDQWLAWYMSGSALAEQARIHSASTRPQDARDAWARSKADMDRALTIARELLAGDPVNLEAARDVTGVLLRRANALRELALAAQNAERDLLLTAAATDFAECLQRRELIWSTDPMQQHRRDLATALFKMAEISDLRNDKAQAAAFAARCLSELEALISEGAMTSENAEVRETRDLIARLQTVP